MSKIATITLSGASARSYEFGAYPLDDQFSRLGAIHYISNREVTESDKSLHTSISVGHTGDISRSFEDHDQKYCFRANGANIIGLHVDPGERSRLEKVQDLVNALQPLCND